MEILKEEYIIIYIESRSAHLKTFNLSLSPNNLVVQVYFPKNNQRHCIQNFFTACGYVITWKTNVVIFTERSKQCAPMNYLQRFAMRICRVE